MVPWRGLPWGSNLLLGLPRVTNQGILHLNLFCILQFVKSNWLSMALRLRSPTEAQNWSAVRMRGCESRTRNRVQEVVAGNA